MRIEYSSILSKSQTNVLSSLVQTVFRGRTCGCEFSRGQSRPPLLTVYHVKNCGTHWCRSASSMMWQQNEAVTWVCTSGSKSCVISVLDSCILLQICAMQIWIDRASPSSSVKNQVPDVLGVSCWPIRGRCNKNSPTVYLCYNGFHLLLTSYSVLLHSVNFQCVCCLIQKCEHF